MLPKISVVIPVYNVENYLHRCVDSVLKQTFQDFEIILINDGSKDSSGKICDEYAKKDKRIKVIHKKNARVSAARNDGIKMAKGKYVSFIDSDDWIEPAMYQEMFNKAEDLDLDFIMCDYKKKSNNYEDKRTQSIRGGYYSKYDIKNELYQSLIMFENIEYPPTISNWVCLFNLNFLKSNSLYYDEDIHYDEDSILGTKIMYHATNFYYLKGHHYYNYFYNPNSTTNTYNEKKWISFLKINERLVKYFGNNIEFDFSRQIKINMLYLTLSALGQIKYSEKGGKERLNMIKKIMFHPKVIEIFKDFKIPNVSWKTKIIIILIKYKMVRPYSLLVLKNRRPSILHFTDELLDKQK
ncbi:glycosyltransferase family 2 protein [Neobacillus niacini]|uniref:glycosyltransferase family 2 protein n=1 Tax=Neobacillus niacini TaxID=86668 RepID=UPI001C8ED5C6|nr:glycosyltransferase family 2 protein [Neobacillus niacini]MBY0145896.1 glycosyltransferase [Neobacillus niacini]